MTQRASHATARGADLYLGMCGREAGGICVWFFGSVAGLVAPGLQLSFETTSFTMETQLKMMAVAQPRMPAKNMNSTTWTAKTANLKFNVMRPIRVKRHVADIFGKFSGRLQPHSETALTVWGRSCIVNLYKGIVVLGMSIGMRRPRVNGGPGGLTLPCGEIGKVCQFI